MRGGEKGTKVDGTLISICEVMYVLIIAVAGTGTSTAQTMRVGRRDHNTSA